MPQTTDRIQPAAGAAFLHRRRLLAAGLFGALAALGGVARAQPEEDLSFRRKVETLYRAWAHVNYEFPDKRAEGVEAARLAAEADALGDRYPGRAEPLMLQALLLLSEADTKRDMRGLNLALTAKFLLDQAQKLNPDPFGDGSLLANIGSLYAAVPGFPVGFGDKKKARRYLDRALAANPAGLDANYFDGDLLYREGRYKEAEAALKRAMAALARPGLEVADRGRKGEAADLLVEVRKKTGG